ncbi:MAG: rRNA maturation RNase YbeY [Candidatus Acidiferrum sp.]
MATKRRKPGAVKMQRGLRTLENRQGAVRLELILLERFWSRARRELRLDPRSASVCFVTDAEMARLNQTFRKKPGTTDVLSFPSETRTRPAGLRRRARALRGCFLGDIAISPTVARRNAKTFGRTLSEEICFLILHGVLHLLGYDHDTDRGEMDHVEASLRRRLGLAR